MDGTLEFRVATKDDLYSIVRLLTQDQLGSLRETLTNPLPKVYFDAFEAMGRQLENIYVIAVLNEEIVGCYQYTVIPGISRSGAARAQIEGVRVDQKNRGLGLGKKMFENAKKRAKASGCNLVQLTTDKTRSDAKRFYEELGFLKSHDGYKLEL